MKTETLKTKPKKKSLSQIFNEYPAFIDRLKEENKNLKANNDALLSALKGLYYEVDKKLINYGFTDGMKIAKEQIEKSEL